jgi:two-component system phosphate regulon response regulator PhoB
MATGELHTLSSRTVLVVDDEASLREILMYFLEGEGFEVAAVGSGTAALEYVRAHFPGAVLLDIALPGASGDEVCRAIRSDARLAGCFVVMMSALPDDEAHRIASRAGADVCLIKPLELSAVAELLRSRVSCAPARSGAAARSLVASPARR